MLVMFGDTPLIRPQTLAPAARRAGRRRSRRGARLPAGRSDRLRPADARRRQLDRDPRGADASAAERAIGLCNGGLMALAGAQALAILDRVGDDNAQKRILSDRRGGDRRRMGLKTVAIEVEEDDVRGINTKAQLAEAEAVLQQRLRQAALDAGVTMVAPETVFLSADTKLGRDVVIEPLCGVRSRRRGRGRSRDPLVLASGGRACRQGRVGRPVRAAAPGHAARARARASAISSRSRRR